MYLVNAENTRITKRAQVIVLLSPVPDNQVISFEADLLHSNGKIRMVRVELALLSNVHNHYTAVSTLPQNVLNLGKYPL
jgi:hypothetical protein